MKKEYREASRIDADIRSAGQAFLAYRMEDLLLRVDELDDIERKNKLIDEYFHNQIGSFDSRIGGTTTRVLSAVRIIKADMVLYALKKIASSDKASEDTVVKAKKTIGRIENGELPLPHLR